jgi:hypothetical protein
MKQYIVVFIMVVAAATLATAQEPLSFRNQALAGIISDDLDLVFDPVELRFIDSLRLYTNLSNLTSTSERLFNNVSDNEFLIGVSRRNPLMDSLWSALLFRFQKAKLAHPISIDSDLNGLSDDFGNGSLQNEYTAYLDLNGNGLYDLRRTISQMKSSTRLTDAYAVVLNNSIHFDGDWTVGLKLAFGTQTSESNTADSPLGSGRGVLFGTNFGDPTFSRSVEEFFIDSNYATTRWSEKGDFNTKVDQPLFRIGVGVMTPVGGWELRGDAAYFNADVTQETGDTYSGMIEGFNPRIAGYMNSYAENAELKGKSGREGNGFGFAGSGRWTFDKQTHRRNDGFLLLGASASFESFDYNNSSAGAFSSSETVFDSESGPLRDFVRKVNSASSTKDDGTGSSNSWQFGARLNVPLLEGVYFGLGALYTLSNLEITTKYTEEFSRSTDYSLTDNLSNAFDTVRTETSGMTADRTMKNRLRAFQVPVGIEYFFSENRCWAIRFGAFFRYLSQTTDDVKQITGSKPFTTRTTLGNNATSVNVQSNVYSSRSEHRTDGDSHTFFTYGLGYFPTSNLQIDLLGFFDVNNRVSLLEFLKSLRLSFVLKP